MKLSKPISLPTLFLLIVLIFQAFMSASSQMSSSEFFQHIRNRDPQNPSTFEQIVLATSNVATTLATAASVCVSVVLCCPCISGALCCVGTCKCAKRVKTLLVDQCPYNQPPQPYQHHQPQQHHHQQQVDPLLGHHPETLQAPPSPPRYPAAAAAAAGVEVGGESGILQDSPRKEKYPRVSPHRYNFEGKSSSDVHFQDDQNIIPGAPAAAQEQNQATATSHAYARQKSSPNRNSLFSFSHSHVPAAAAAAAAANFPSMHFVLFMWKANCQFCTVCFFLSFLFLFSNSSSIILYPYFIYILFMLVPSSWITTFFFATDTKVKS
eukprot:Sdes_comp21329_c0_seq1m19967